MEAMETLPRISLNNLINAYNILLKLIYFCLINSMDIKTLSQSNFLSSVQTNVHLLRSFSLKSLDLPTI